MAEGNARPTDAETAKELQKQTAEPMLPAEWWLVGGSLGLGLVLLGVLLALSPSVPPTGRRPPQPATTR